MRTSEFGAPVVLIRVRPRMLADVLARVLVARGVVVLTAPAEERRARPRTVRHVDMAVVTDALPADVETDHLWRIDDSGEVSLEGGSGEMLPLDAGLDVLLGSIDRLSS